MQSCLYEGQVVHHRFEPREHRFSYGLYMCYLDLAELPGVLDASWLWSARRAAPSWFRRADYLDPGTPDLDTAVRDRVEGISGERPRGPIRMLTHLRTWGYCFNPVTFYYLFDQEGDRARSVLAEITNTPWKERHAYLVPCGAESRFDKAFHVSPFMPMDHEYRWRLDAPGERLAVHMENHRDGRKVFDADLALRRTEINSASLARVLFRYPWMTLQVVATIHAQAARLWRKKIPFHSHPSKLREEA
jgi:DUF1365 family protein